MGVPIAASRGHGHRSRKLRSCLLNDKQEAQRENRNGGESINRSKPTFSDVFLRAELLLP